VIRELRIAFGEWLVQRAFYVLPESEQRWEVAKIICRWHERLRGIPPEHMTKVP
jgi:hypothetical protein